jgi:Ca2+-binding RTX toxin-like protein
VVVEAAAGGTDTILSDVSYSLASGSEVEALQLRGEGNFNATGNELANTLGGNNGNNVLDGGAGADRMSGGNGDDTYVVDNAGDIVDEAGYLGNDTVLSSVSYGIDVWVEKLVLTGTEAIDATGSTWADTLIGNSGANILDGGFGADTMSAGAGDDIYMVDDIGDVVVETSSADGFDTVFSTASFTLGANVEKLVLTGTEAVDGSGNSLNNRMTGDSAANSLSGMDGDDVLIGLAGSDKLAGGAGNDWLAGGAGSDALTGGLGADRFYFDAAPTSGIDSIADMAANDLIYLHAPSFGGLAAGALTSSVFHRGAVATSAEQRIIYDSVTGSIYYDADGNGSGAAVKFATVAAGTSLTAASFVAYSYSGFPVESSQSYVLGSGEESLTLTGTGSINGTGNGLDNRISGNDAGNEVRGLDCDDTLLGNGGDDRLWGGTGNDHVSGAEGNDHLFGDAGNDVLDGGEGHSDWVSYGEVGGGGVVISLAVAGPQNTVSAGIDTLVGIENLAGTEGNDRLTGDGGANQLLGRSGPTPCPAGPERTRSTAATGAISTWWRMRRSMERRRSAIPERLVPMSCASPRPPRAPWCCSRATPASSGSWSAREPAPPRLRRAPPPTTWTRVRWAMR